MKRTVYLLLILISTYFNAFSQELNNEQNSFDKSDSENISKFFFGIETYKFYVRAKLNDDFDIILEEYSNEEKKSTSKLVSDVINKYGINPLNRNFGDEFVRIYVKNSTIEKNSVDLGIKYLSLSAPKKLENLDLKLLQSRAFTNIPTEIEEKTPVLVIYGNKTGNLISCPGDAKPSDIIKLYDWVCIISLEKIKKDKE